MSKEIVKVKLSDDENSPEISIEAFVPDRRDLHKSAATISNGEIESINRSLNIVQPLIQTVIGQFDQVQGVDELEVKFGLKLAVGGSFVITLGGEFNFEVTLKHTRRQG